MILVYQLWQFFWSAKQLEDVLAATAALEKSRDDNDSRLLDYSNELSIISESIEQLESQCHSGKSAGVEPQINNHSNWY